MPAAPTVCPSGSIKRGIGMNIRLNLSNAFINKQTVASIEARYCKNHKTLDTCWAFGSTFKPATVSLAAFDEHRRSGKAWTLHAFKGNRRIGSEWVSAQALALDLDECPLTAPELAALPFIRDHAHSVEPSPSNTAEKPKTRIIFVLSEPVTQGEAWKALQIALMTHFADLHPDVKCKDLARLFYGSTQPGGITLGNILDLKLAGGLIQPLAELENFERDERIKNPPVRIEATSDKAQRIVYRRFNRALDELTAASTDRHDKLIKTAAYLFGHVNGGWPLTAAEVERGLVDACARNGYLSKVGEHEITRCINDMRGAAGIPLEVHESKTSRRSATKGRRIDGAKTATEGACTVRYVSDDLTPKKIHGIRTLTIDAPVGMGKTSAVAAYVNSLPADQQVTGVAQYRLLTMAVANAFKDSSHYEDSDHAHQRALGSMARLVTSLSSLPKFTRAGGVVIADELEGDLQFLVNSGTFEGGEAVAAYRAFKALVASADQFIGMDANYSEISGNWLRGIRGDVTEKRYQRHANRGKVTFLSNRYAAIWQVGKLLRQRRGQVYVACSSEATASDIADLFTGDAYRVLKVTRDTSNTQPVQAFIKNEHGERGDYDLIVYTSAMGAGVDISESVFALVGIFDKLPLAPENAIQLYGRVRNAQRYYAAVPPGNEAYTTPTADDLLADKLKREIWTAQRAGVDAQVSGDYLEMLQLWSQFEARRLRESAQWHHYFAQRLHANGYTVTVNPAKAPQAFIDNLKAWRSERADENWQFVQNADGLGRSDDDLSKLRMAGVEITRELRLQNTRYKIERALGHDHITDLDRDLMTWHGRNRLFHLSDLFTAESELIASDRQQSAEGRPLQKRKHRTLNQRMIAALLRLAGFTDATVEGQYLAFVDYFRIERPASEISERFEAFTTQHALSKFQALGHYGNNARSAVGLCRWLLEYCGLKLNSTRRGRAEGRYMAYQLDADLLDYQLTRARRSAQERTRNVSIQGEYTFVVHAADAATPSNATRLIPPGTGWRHVETPALNREIAFVPSGTGASKINPFSVGA